MDEKKYRVWHESKFHYFDEIKSAQEKAENDENKISKLVGEDREGRALYTHDIVKIENEEAYVYSADHNGPIILRFTRLIPDRIFNNVSKNELLKINTMFQKIN